MTPKTVQTLYKCFMSFVIGMCIGGALGMAYQTGYENGMRNVAKAIVEQMDRTK